MLSVGFKSFAYAESYRGAQLTQQAIGNGLSAIEGYVSGPPPPGVPATFNVPVEPLTNQIKLNWMAEQAAKAQQQQAAAATASPQQVQPSFISPAATTHEAVPPPVAQAQPAATPAAPAAPEASPTAVTTDVPPATSMEQKYASEAPPSPAPEQPVKEMSLRSFIGRRIRGAPIVMNAIENPIAPHHEKQHPEAHLRIGHVYKSRAAGCIKELSEVDGHEDSIQNARHAARLLTHCIVAIETGRADERHYHAIETLQTVAPILNGIKHKEMHH